MHVTATVWNVIHECFSYDKLLIAFNNPSYTAAAFAHHIE